MARIIFALVVVISLAAPASAQNLLDRLQGLYFPDLPGSSWTCRDLGSDGGALGLQGNRLLGVETSCTLTDPFPIPGMDAIRFRQSCSGEGQTWEPGPIILMPSDRGMYLLSEGYGREWLRCRG